MRVCSTLVRPSLSRPRLVTEVTAAQHASVVALELEHDQRAFRAGHELSAGFVHRAHHGAEHGPRRDPAVGEWRQRRLPEPPALAVDRAEGAGIWSGLAANEVVDRGDG